MEFRFSKIKPLLILRLLQGDFDWQEKSGLTVNIVMMIIVLQYNSLGIFIDRID